MDDRPYTQDRFLEKHYPVIQVLSKKLDVFIKNDFSKICQ